MVEMGGQAGATGDRNKFCDPDGFLIMIRCPTSWL
jgi:hypothetical protein